MALIGTINASNDFAFKNRIINGAMVIDQRNAGNTVNNTTSNLYTLDRWAIYGVASAKFRVAQSGMPAVNTAGFSSCIQIYSLAATTVGATDIYVAFQIIEGYNFADMLWGTASALPVTLSFWVYSTLTGTFGGYVKGGSTYSYPFTYTVSSANTWTKATVTIPGQTAGTWNTTNSGACIVGFSFGAGSTYVAAANSWTGGDYYGATGQTQFVSTSAATMYITGVQLEKGATATSFDYRPYGTELALCERYYAKFSSLSGNFIGFGSGASTATTSAAIVVKYPVRMRAAPTVTQSNTALYDAGAVQAVTSIGGSYIGNESCFLNLTVAAGMTLGRGCIWCGNDNASAYIDLSSEL
jgi:hypothetical protein